jgi:hypothetical protein
MSERKEKRRIRKETKLMQKYDMEHDIRYLGPLSYRSFKILGWLCIAMLQVVALLELEGKFDPVMMAGLYVPVTVLRLLSNMALPFFLISNFALILNAADGYKRQLLMNGVFSLAVVAASVFGFRRYVLGIASFLYGEGTDASAQLADTFYANSEGGYISYNLFIDLFLCALLMFFLNYRPKRFFTGKKLLFFRAFAAFPIVYEIACIVLKSLCVERIIKLPFIVFPFLTVKPSMTFLVFVILAGFIKRRERRFLKTGRTHEEYIRFLKTRRNSFQFSRFTAIILAVIGVLDFAGMLLVGAIIHIVNPAKEMVFEYVSAHLSALGIGQSMALLLLAPLMLLFSYTRSPENKTLDTFIPIIGVAIIVLVYIEGGYQFLLMVPDMLASLNVGGIAGLGIPAIP